MKITGSGRIDTTPIRRKNVSGAGQGADFSLDHAEDASKPHQAAATSATGSVSSISALLSLQEVDDEVIQGRRKAFNRAEEMLDLLEDLRHGLLKGSLPAHKLNRLLTLVKVTHESFLDPKLSQILSDIELRAMVELAKIEMSRVGS